MSRPILPKPATRAAIGFDERARASSRALAEGGRAGARCEQGMALVLAGCIVAIMGLVPYCAASFAGDASADLGAIVFHGAAPAARGSLLVVAAGTLLWIVGAVVHATAALVTADERPGR